MLMTADTVGGVWTHALELAAALDRQGVRVVLATMGTSLSPSQHAQLAQQPALQVHESRYGLEWMEDPWRDLAKAGEWLMQIEREVRPDVVHLNQFAFGALPFAAPVLVVAHSCVLSWWRAVHGEPAPASWDRYRQVVAQGLAGADLVSAPTRAMLASLADNHGHSGVGVVLPNARSAETFWPGTKQEFIFSAGRWWDEAKNIGALEAVAPRLPWPVHVAGPAAAPGGQTRQCHGLTLLGELSTQALAAQYARAAIFALPARYEPFGQTALEAGLAGCALVLGDVPSLREVWGPAALYVPPEDHAALHATLMRLIAEPDLRAAYGREVRVRALRYTPQRMARDYLAAYRTAAARASSRKSRSKTRITQEVPCAS